MFYVAIALTVGGLLLIALYHRTKKKSVLDYPLDARTFAVSNAFYKQ